MFKTSTTLLGWNVCTKWVSIQCYSEISLIEQQIAEIERTQQSPRVKTIGTQTDDDDKVLLHGSSRRGMQTDRDVKKFRK